MVQKIIGLKNRFLDFYQKHEALVSVAVFIAGFIFDILTLGRIDDLLNLIQQSIYLIILGSLLVLEVKIEFGTLELSDRGRKFWEYHNLIVHFLFGSLLSAYTIFYYTSASAVTSFFYILLLAGLMLVNEIPRIQKLGLTVRVILYCICVLSYFAFFYPILMGRVGPLPFWLGFLSSALALSIIWKINFKNIVNLEVLKKRVIVPAIGIHLFFLAGYYFSLIPPVPVAVKKIGVYYDVTKSDGIYYGKHLQSFWSFWNKGSREFLARHDDKVFILLSVFSPARFEDKIYLKWYIDDPKLGWHLEDTIPLTILGGREEGFRGFGSKKYYREGDWKVIVETSDGREVGRIKLEIKKDSTQTPRTFETDAF